VTQAGKPAGAEKPAGAGKPALRKRGRSILARAGRAERAAWSQGLCRLLLDLEELTRSRVVGAYWPVRREPDVLSALAAMRAGGRRVLLPVVTGEILRYGEPAGFEPGDVPRGAFGIPAPGGPTEPASALDLVLVPGLAFDRHGHRLGSGYGYYDRTFADPAARPLLIGVAFEVMLVDTVGAADHDVPLDLIVTERQVVRPTLREGDDA